MGTSLSRESEPEDVAVGDEHMPWRLDCHDCQKAMAASVTRWNCDHCGRPSVAPHVCGIGHVLCIQCSATLCVVCGNTSIIAADPHHRYPREQCKCCGEVRAVHGMMDDHADRCRYGPLHDTFPNSQVRVDPKRPRTFADVLRKPMPTASRTLVFPPWSDVLFMHKECVLYVAVLFGILKRVTIVHSSINALGELRCGDVVLRVDIRRGMVPYDIPLPNTKRMCSIPADTVTFILHEAIPCPPALQPLNRGYCTLRLLLRLYPALLGIDQCRYMNALPANVDEILTDRLIISPESHLSILWRVNLIPDRCPYTHMYFYTHHNNDKRPTMYSTECILCGRFYDSPLDMARRCMGLDILVTETSLLQAYAYKVTVAQRALERMGDKVVKNTQHGLLIAPEQPSINRHIKQLGAFRDYIDHNKSTASTMTRPARIGVAWFTCTGQYVKTDILKILNAHFYTTSPISACLLDSETPQTIWVAWLPDVDGLKQIETDVGTLTLDQTTDDKFVASVLTAFILNRRKHPWTDIPYIQCI